MKNMSKKVRIFIIALILIILAVAVPLLWYNSSILAIDKNSTEKVKVQIPIGSTANDISKILKDNDLIKSDLAFKVYVKLNKISDFQAGNYELYKNMDVSELTKTLQTGKLHNQISITFIEGRTINWYANKIEEQTNNSKEAVFEVLSNEEYIDSLIEKYWFLTDEIKNENIYYPLEGYLFPDTYFFKSKDITVEEIFEELLNQTDKVLSEYKDKFKESEYSIHEIITIASIVEKEGIYPEDRKDISSVIYNRLAKKMAIQSDVTTYYAAKVEVGSRDLYISELNEYNPYNTRGPKMEGKLPIGPISSVSKNAIEAALEPNDTDYIFFVADKNGKVYFNRTGTEHSNTITQLQEQGLWYEF